MKICSVEGCEKKIIAKGLCPQHYMNKRNNGTVYSSCYPVPKPYACTVPDCGKIGLAKGLCEMHYDRQLHYNRLYRVMAPYGTGYVRNGYRVISRNGKVKLEHRRIMEESLGRELTSKEIVHHANGDTLDNKIENLSIVTNSNHTKLHHERGDINKHTVKRINI